MSECLSYLKGVCALLLCALCVLAFASCERVTLSTAPNSSDTIYVDEGRVQQITLRGKVTLTKQCIPRAYSPGVTVSIPALGLATLTDSLGRYSFYNVPLKETILTFAKDGYYEKALVEKPRYTDTGYTVQTMRIAPINAFSGRFDGDTTMYYSPIYSKKDTFFVHPDGTHGRTQVSMFVRDAYVIRFRIYGVNESDAPTSDPAFILVSASADIDPLDSTTYFYSDAASNEPGLEGAILHTETLEKVGIRSGSPYFVTVTSMGWCGGFGSRHGEVRRYVRP